jgi:hypothetical protein
MKMSEFSVAFDQWRPVELEGSAIPEFWGVPHHLRYRFIVSGELLAPLPYESDLIDHGYRVGGIYAYRHGTDGRATLKRDDYHVVLDEDDPDNLRVDGPFKDRRPGQHHTDEVPSQFSGIRVVRL